MYGNSRPEVTDSSGRAPAQTKVRGLGSGAGAPLAGQRQRSRHCAYPRVVWHDRSRAPATGVRNPMRFGEVLHRIILPA